MVLHLQCSLAQEYKPMALLKEIIRNAQLPIRDFEMLRAWVERHPWNLMIMQQMILTGPPETSSASSSHSQRRPEAQPIAQPVPAASTAPAASKIMRAHPKRMPQQAKKGKGRGMAEAKTEAKAKAGRQGQMHEQDLHAIDRLETELRQAKKDFKKRGRQENEQDLHADDRAEEDLRQAKKDLQKRGFEIGPAPPKCPPPGAIPRFLIGWM